jgi:autotransporter-associated beta strand protein
VIQDGTTISGSSVTAGIGGTGNNGGGTGTNGQALGVDFFVMASGQLTFSQSGSLTISSDIIGDAGVGGGSTSAGGLTMNGSGTLTLSGTNTYTGSNSMNGGTVAITNDNNLGAAANPLSFSNGTLQTTGTFSTSRTISLPTLGATGTFKVTNLADTYTINSAISGAGSLGVAGAGTLSLPGTGSYTYTGSTTIGDTSTLALSGTGSLATSSGVVANATFDVTGVTAASTSIVDLSGSSSGAVKLAAKNLTLTNPSSTFSGVISGVGGSLTKQGSGTFTLSGTNTYTGGTALSAGQITLGNSSGLGTGNLAMSDTTTLGLNNGVSASNSVAIAGSGTGTFFVDTGNSGTLSGGISGVGSAVAKTGAGTLTLSTSTNSYSGTTTISAGTLALSGAASIASSPLVTVSGSTTFDLSAITASTNIVNLAGSGSVFLGTSKTLVLTNPSGTFAGSISDTTGGAVTKQGAGTFTLSGSNTYHGTTTISAGTWQAGATNAFSSSSAHAISSVMDLNSFSQIVDTISGSGSITLNGGTLTTGAAGATSFAGSISDGTTSGGGLTKQNAGTFTLSGSNTYSGATNVTGGTLQAAANNTFSSNSDYTVGSGAILALQTFNQTIGLLSGAGNVTSAATLTTGTSGNSTFSGNLVGGTLNKVGSGTLSLTGSGNSIASATVSAGKLAVNTPVSNPLVVAGSLTMDSGATLGGTGAITATSITIQNGATLSPGNSIGTLTFTGPVTQATGSTLEIEISPSGGTIAHDEIVINGSYTIQPGATLLIEPDPGVYPSSFSFPIVDASPGQLFGTFSNVIVTLPTFQPTVEYLSGPGDIVLTGITLLPFSNFFTRGNAGAVAACLDTLSPSPGSDLELVLAELRMISTLDELAQNLVRFQPSQFTALALAQENTMLYTSDTIFYRLRQDTEFCGFPCKECHPKKRFGYWITPYTGFANQKKKNEQPGFNTIAGGFTTGFDVNASKHWIVGSALGYSYDHLKWREGSGHANIQDGFGAFYLGTMAKHAYLFGSFLGSYDHYKTYRHIKIGDDILMEINRTAKGSHNGWHASGHLQAGLLFEKKAQFSPFVQANYIYIHENGFKEHGADGLNLKVHKKNSDLLEGEAGFEIARCFSAGKISPSAGFSVIREWRFKGKHTKSSFKDSSCVMNTTGMNPDRTLFSPTADLTFLLPNENRTLSFEYKGKFGDKFHDNRILAQFLIKF